MIAITNVKDLESNVIMRDYYNKNVNRNLTFSKRFDEYSLTENYDELLLARNLFDLKEIKKSAHILRKFVDNVNEQSCMFMHNYSLYLHADMKMREERYQNEYEKGKRPNTPITFFLFFY